MKIGVQVGLGVFFVLALPDIKSLANDVSNFALTEKALVQLHSQLNECEADAIGSGLPNYGKCSEIQHMLISHYSDYEEYQQARRANQ
jgi:hypothetical protein